MLTLDLRGRAAFISGSTGGIGFAAARRLAECGADVTINGRDAERVQHALASLQAAVPEATFRGVTADITSDAGRDRVFEAVPNLDILVCNAATFDWTGFFETTDEDWLRHYRINVLSPAALARHYLRSMLDVGRGRIVMVASEAGLNIPPEMIHYGVAKAAQIALARGLAELTRGSDVTVNSVLPGPTASSNADAFLADYARQNAISPERAEEHLMASIRPTSLLRRLATVDEVANMIAYVCSDLSSATNGAALRVEGGLLRHPG